MNCNEARKIPLKSILTQIGAAPIRSKKRGQELWYKSPFRNESTASFKVDTIKNLYYDFGEGKGGNVLDFIMRHFKCDLKGALRTLRIAFNYFSFRQHTLKKDASERKKDNPKIRKIKSVEHPALLIYLKKRKVYGQCRHLKEVHYTLGSKFYFGIGFRNDSGGWEIRNKYSKVCLGRKKITTIKNGCDTLRVFEGFFDYLSFLKLRTSLEMSQSNYIILNSVALVDHIRHQIGSYRKIEFYLDNDKAGNRAMEKIKMTYPKVEDNRILYRDNKDLNEFLIQNINSKKNGLDKGK